MSSTQTLPVAVIQMKCAVGGVSALNENLQKAESLIEQAVLQGAKWVVLPEAFDFGYELRSEVLNELPEATPTRDSLQAWAKRWDIHLFAGILEREGDVIHNRLLAVAPHKLPQQYSKIHLFCSAPTWENQAFKAGETPVAVDTPWGRVGLMICYDLRFPELARQYFLAHCDFIVVSSAWGLARRQHFKTLTSARAIENQCFILSADQVGTAESQLSFAGASAIYDPQGETLGMSEEGVDQVVFAQLDMSQRHQTQKFMDCLGHRRPEVYQQPVRVL